MTETETETSQYPWEIFSKYFPPFLSLVFFSSRKKIFSFSEYHPSFSSPPEQKVNVNIAVFSFLHLIDRNKTKVIRIQIRYFQCFLGLVFFLLFWFFQDQVFRNRNQDLFFRDQIFRNRNRDFFPRPNFFETETFFHNQIFRNQKRDFFPRHNFFETETETFFLDQFFSKPRLFFWNQIFVKPKPSKIWQKFRNQNVNLCLQYSSI